MGEKSLTVCICVRDGEQWIDSCLAALVPDGKALGVPILVVNHNYQDGTALRFTSWQQQGGIKVHKFTVAGLAAVRDFAWRQSETNWVAFVDVDCVVAPGWMQQVLAQISKNQNRPSVAAIGGLNLVPRNRGRLYEMYALFLSTFIGGHNSILNREFTKEQSVDHVPTLNVIYRRSALETIGGFDLNFTRVCEDLDVSYRLRQAGFQCIASPKFSVDHYLRPTVLAWVQNIFLYGRGRFFHMRKNRNDFQPLFLIPGGIVLIYLGALLLDGAGGRLVGFSLVLTLLHLLSIGFFLAPKAMRERRTLSVWLGATGLVWLTHLAFGFGFLRQGISLKREFA